MNAGRRLSLDAACLVFCLAAAAGEAKAEASVEELTAVKGIGPELARAIYGHFHPNGG